METQETTNNTTEPTGSWYSRLIKEIGSVSEELELESEQRSTLREFILKVAKQQYQVGNKSGIRWLLQEQEKKRREAAPATA